MNGIISSSRRVVQVPSPVNQGRGQVSPAYNSWYLSCVYTWEYQWCAPLVVKWLVMEDNIISNLQLETLWPVLKWGRFHLFFVVLMNCEPYMCVFRNRDAVLCCYGVCKIHIIDVECRWIGARVVTRFTLVISMIFLSGAWPYVVWWIVTQGMWWRYVVWPCH